MISITRSIYCVLLSCIAFALTTGCLFKANTMVTRSFVLNPMPLEKHRAESVGHLSIGIGLVKMPPYLKKLSMAIRKGDHEIEFIDNALWAEHLSDLFQHTLASNLSELIPTDQIHISAWQRDEVALAVHVTVEQFDVDATGTGRLFAWWRLVNPTTDKVIKSDGSRLSSNGPAPQGNPQAMATTLSSLISDFSRLIAQSIHDSQRTEATAR